MKLHEYQAKEVFSKAGIPIPRGRIALSEAEAVAAAEEIGFPCVLKAQVLVGGRGKAGGIKVCSTDTEIERAALYRTLRQLEKAGNVTSKWEVEKSGPARRIYRLTPKGLRHLDEWIIVLGHVSRSMARFVAEAHGTNIRKRRATANRA